MATDDTIISMNFYSEPVTLRLSLLGDVFRNFTLEWMAGFFFEARTEPYTRYGEGSTGEENHVRRQDFLRSKLLRSLAGRKGVNFL